MDLCEKYDIDCRKGMLVMKEYHFDKATPLLEFLEENKELYVHRTLKRMFSDMGFYVPFRGTMLENAIGFLIDETCIIIDYYVPSSMTLRIATLEEIQNDKTLQWMLRRYEEVEDKETHPLLMSHVPLKDMKDHKISSIEVERFSSMIELTEDAKRPAGGDYFGTIKLVLDNGVEICFCGADALCDGYIQLWGA